MEAVKVASILNDFRAIKLPKARRDFIDRCRERLESSGHLSRESLSELHSLLALYSRKISELHEARERARVSNGLRKMGMTREDAAKIRNERLEAERKHRSDLGI